MKGWQRSEGTLKPFRRPVVLFLLLQLFVAHLLVSRAERIPEDSTESESEKNREPVGNVVFLRTGSK